MLPNSNGMKIGFFDSGIGGLTILTSVRELLPEYDYLFYGDTKNLPYGDKSEGEIYALTKRGVEYLFDQGALLVVIACNTASAESLRKLQDTLLVEEYVNKKLLGVIIPTIESIVESKIQNVVLVGTTRTIDSKKYERELAKFPTNISLLSIPTPELVPLIESGNITDAWNSLCKTLSNVKGEEEGGMVVLGCTHYTLLKEQIRANSNWKVISQDEVIPEKLKLYLTKHSELEKLLTKNNSIEVTFTDTTLNSSKLVRDIITSARE